MATLQLDFVSSTFGPHRDGYQGRRRLRQHGPQRLLGRAQGVTEAGEHERHGPWQELHGDGV